MTGGADVLLQLHALWDSAHMSLSKVVSLTMQNPFTFRSKLVFVSSGCCSSYLIDIKALWFLCCVTDNSY